MIFIVLENQVNKSTYGTQLPFPNPDGPYMPHLPIADNISSIYTSGRKCNFQGKGCEGAIFDPINVNGWFWAGAGNTRMPPTNQPSQKTFWSHTGP